MKTSVAAILALLLSGGFGAVAAEPVDPAKNLEAVRKAVGSLQSQLDELGKAIAERDKAKETAAASSIAEVAELRAEVAAIRQGMTEQRKAVDQAQAEAFRLGEENKGLRAKLDQATKERDEAAKARDVVTKERDEAARARDAAMRAKGETAKARDAAVASSKSSSAQAEEIERLKKELAESWRQVAELERQASSLAAGQVQAAANQSAPEVASAEPAAPSEPPAAPASAVPGASAAVGGIKQWRQPDGTLFFGDNPPVAGSKLITVIGGGAPVMPDEAAPRTASP